MGANLVSLTVNPCKMCMPMGAVTALCGIQNTMTILHGSQGCATYIRRHMATHYNEPIDIASSSLTEQGTVFGGEKNLVKGLENLISLYHPDLIGIATTCLAETIGEDVEAYIKKFKAAHPAFHGEILSVSTAGYGATQYEGFFRALRAAVSQLALDDTPNDCINLIVPDISPADTRWLKGFLREAGVNFILLPDLSETLDGVSVARYERLKSGGTALADIRRMAGARLTIEFSEFVPDGASPAEYLNERFGVPVKRLPMPSGIRAMDALAEAIVQAGGVLTDEYQKERGRYLDAIVDAHKYCAQARACIFGEPDFVLAMTRLCCENGIVPVAAVTGSVCHRLRDLLEPEMMKAAERMFVESYEIADDADFTDIETLCRDLGANVMIGSSDGRRVSERLGIPLVRCAFPIHDRVGGQRVRILGFDGSLFLTESVANLMLAHTETHFRGEMYENYFNKEEQAVTNTTVMPVIDLTKSTAEKTIEEKNAAHPCFNCGAHKNARMHLPVAPKCNIQCNYCVRKYDCPNESRPGVTTEVLSPAPALEKYKVVKAKVPNLTVVGIAGPGDALANFPQLKETLTLLREYDPQVTFCLSTNGLMLPLYAQELIDLGVSHITVTMNAVDAEIGAKIYSHVDFMGMRMTGVAGASVLLANQLAGLTYLTARGIVCKVNVVTLKGINDTHIEAISEKAKALGVYVLNIMPHIPVEGSAFENLDTMNNKEINTLRQKCAINIKQMYHCRQCRADAIGMLDDDVSIEFRGCSGSCGEKADAVPMIKIAVATKSGMLVDCHFGHAEEFYLYESDGNLVRFLEKRGVEKYCTGADSCDDHESKMDKILRAVADCQAVLALRTGETPKQKLEAQGIAVITTYDRIEDAVKKAAEQLRVSIRV
ncbi:MAG: nitrogenase component 1 [Oscillospiraceae bacterium]